MSTYNRKIPLRWIIFNDVNDFSNTKILIALAKIKAAEKVRQLYQLNY